jgi:U3 small nucleolar RNA-associated protein 21
VNRTTKALEKTLKTNTRSANLEKKLLDDEMNAKQERYLNRKLQNASHVGHAVTGLAVDILNKALISVGLDSKLIVWNLMTQSPHQKCPYMLPQPATKLCHVRESDLAAIALQDYSVILFDCSSSYIVRRFGAGTNVHHKHTDGITDLCFSGDGRSLYTSLDSTIRVWDVPTNKCVDWLAFKSPPTSLTISPTGQYLATTHVDRVGINLWSDKSFYETVHADGEELTQPAYMDEPTPIDDTALGSVKYNSVLPTMVTDQRQPIDDSGNTIGIPILAKEKGLITLSGLPVAHWKNLFHLELVKQRNKPREPPKKPPSAPFFLQWRGEQIPASEPVPEVTKALLEVNDDEAWAAAWSDDEEADNPMEMDMNALQHDDEKILQTIATKRPKITHFRSHIASLLTECNSKDRQVGERRYQAVTEYIATLGPSGIDVALSSLCNGLHDLNEGLPLLILASEWLDEACQTRERFEAINSYLHRFLFVHSLTIATIESRLSDVEQNDSALTADERNVKQSHYERLLASIAHLKNAQQSAIDDLRTKMDHTLCLLRHFSRMI